MSCECGLKLKNCMWPGQCTVDIRRHQEATAAHTASMVNIPINQWNEMMYGKKEIKMTRKEAIELAKKFSHEVPYYEYDIALLEALGLIKFDKEVGPLDNIQRSKLFEFYNPATDDIKDGYLTTNACKALIDDLDKQGYKIVKK